MCLSFSSEIPPKVLIDHPQLLQFLDYDFVIASMYLESAAYKDYYLKHGRRNTMILDNGAFEKGESIATGDFLKVIDELQPGVVVIPDVRQNHTATHKKVISFFDDLPRKYKKKHKFMGVVQGTSYKQWDHLLRQYQKLGVDLIGIPYGTLDRISFIRQYPKVKFHVLGLQYFPELFSLNLLENVVSFDTSLPTKYAAKCQLLTDSDYLTVDERPNFEHGFDTRQMHCLHQNLRVIKIICNRERTISYKIGE